MKKTTKIDIKIKAEKVCKECGKIFIDNSISHCGACCSKECSNRLWYKRNKSIYSEYRKHLIVLETRKCLECRTEFSCSNTKIRKFCSVSCSNKYWYKHNLQRHKISSRKAKLKKEYKITPEEYKLLFDKQGGRCAICGKTSEENNKRLGVDHCHKTNKIRGLLCDKCNTGIGLLADDIGRLEAAISYLKNK